MSDHISHEGMDSQIECACRADACNSGRKPCPCPESCAVPCKERMGNVKGWERWSLNHPAAAVYLIVAVASLACVSVLHIAMVVTA